MEKCNFEGVQPEFCTILGKITYYHDGDVSLTAILKGKNIFTGTGNVWAIFKCEEMARKTVFKIRGKVQTCYDF